MGACMSKKMPEPTASAVPATAAPTKELQQPTQTKELVQTTNNTTSSPTDVDTAATAATTTTTPETTTKSLHDNQNDVNTAAMEGRTGEKEIEKEKGEDEPEAKNQYQDALNDRLMQMGDKLAVHNEKNENTLLAPINGVSLEKYATIQAHIAQNSKLYDTILAKHNLTKSEWETVDQGWQQNMKKDAATGGVAILYGKYYMAAGTGDYGVSGSEAAAVMNIAGVSTGEAPQKGGEEHQVSFDKYLEWMGAQSAWSSLGLDVNAKLKEVFNITAHDYANVAGYWSMKMMSDMNLAMKMGDGITKWTQEYMQHPNGPGK